MTVYREDYEPTDMLWLWELTNASSPRLIGELQGNAVAVRRFDRAGDRRLHAMSANVALKAMKAELGYPELAQLLRRRGGTGDGRAMEQMRELFRRMVFNILIDNTDDHEKNHVLLNTQGGELRLSPAFDVLPSGQALGYQQLRVGTEGHDATIDNAMTETRLFGLKDHDASAEVARVARVVAGWKEHFGKTGVASRGSVRNSVFEALLRGYEPALVNRSA
jgi:serine/threonine-protein kinase HipA